MQGCRCAGVTSRGATLAQHFLPHMCAGALHRMSRARIRAAGGRNLPPTQAGQDALRAESSFAERQPLRRKPFTERQPLRRKPFAERQPLRRKPFAGVCRIRPHRLSLLQNNSIGRSPDEGERPIIIIAFQPRNASPVHRQRRAHYPRSMPSNMPGSALMSASDAVSITAGSTREASA